MSKTISLTEKYKKILTQLYDCPNFLKIKQLEPYLTSEQVIVELIKTNEQSKSNFNYNEHSYIHNIIESNTNSLDLNTEYIIESHPFLNINALASRQNFEVKLPNTLKTLQNDFVEIDLFCLTKDTNCDAITNLTVQFVDNNKVNNEFECFLKLTGTICCSMPIGSNSKIKFLDFPNILISRVWSKKNHNIGLRCNKSLLSDIDTSNFSFIIEYDAIYTNPNKLLHSMTPKYQYYFETSNGILIICIDGLYSVRFYTQLVDNVALPYKQFYGDL